MNRATFYTALRRRGNALFGTSLSQGQVEGCEAILDASDGLPPLHRAYLLATAWHETARSMQPIKETVMPHHKDKNPSDAEVIRRLDNAWNAGRLPQVKAPYWRDGWFGRGYVQLTHRRNYERASAALGVDFVANPGLAMVPKHAAAILVRGCVEGWFTGKRLSDYADPVNMRRVVNGLDRAQDIATASHAFLAAITEAQSAAPAVEIPQARESIWAALWRAMVGIWKGRA